MVEASLHQVRRRSLPFPQLRYVLMSVQKGVGVNGMPTRQLAHTLQQVLLSLSQRASIIAIS